MSETLKLSACPFCGGEGNFGTIKYSERTARKQEWGQDTFYFVSCASCGGRTDALVGKPTEYSAAEAWNRRQPISEEALSDVIACTLYGGEFQTPDQVYVQINRHQNKTVVDLAKRIIAHLTGKAGT